MRSVRQTMPGQKRLGPCHVQGVSPSAGKAGAIVLLCVLQCLTDGYYRPSEKDVASQVLQLIESKSFPREYKRNLFLKGYSYGQHHHSNR
jgi:hypothetical protein